MLMLPYKLGRHSGFTIVELLIVIVVIAILAAIGIASYRTIQERAAFAKVQTELKSIKQALDMYYNDNGHPAIIGPDQSHNCIDRWCGVNQEIGNEFIPGISPQYINRLPQLPEANESLDSYLYRASSQGRSFQLIRFRHAAMGGLSGAERRNNPLLATGQGYDGLAWGYKSDPSDEWF